MKNKTIRALMSSLAFLCIFTSCGATTSTPLPSNSSNDPYVKSVEITSQPNKLSYYEGEIFAAEGLKFDATWVIRGKEKVVSQNKSACTWTYKTTPLTVDVDKITFTIKHTNFNFDIPITVNSLSAQGIKVDHSSFNENYLEGDVIDLNRIRVQLETSVGSGQTLSPGSYTIYDNDKEIQLTNAYVLTAGKHTFKVKFGQKEDSFTIRAWAKSELKATKLVLKNTSFGSTLFEGQTINLNKIVVEETWAADNNVVTFTEVVTDYELYDNGKLISKADRENYALSAGKHIFEVRKDNLSASFEVTTSAFDSLVVEKKTESNTVSKNTSFYANYAVYLADSNNPSSRLAVNKGDYAISAKRNGQPVANVNEENVFAEEGEVEVTITYKSFVKVINAVVEGAIIINTSNMVFTKDLPLDGNGEILRNEKGEVINADGSLFTTMVPGTYSPYQIGKNFLEVPPNNGSYGDVGVYDNPGHIGNIKSGQKLVFHIWSDKEANADLVIYAASMNFADMNNWDGTYPTETSVEYYKPTVTEDVQFNSGISTTFGKEETPFNVSDSVIVPGYTSQITEPNGQKADTQGRYFDDRIWTAWSPVVLGKMSLKKGDNIVTLHVHINQLNIGLLEVRL